MRKRSGRPPQFVAVPNETVDDALNLDFMAMGLHTVLRRHRDGWDVTLAKIGEKYDYGRDAMAGAMGFLQVARYVVKVRFMTAKNNRWATEVVVYDTPASEEEIAELVAAIDREPEVRPGTAEVIPPTAKAVEAAAKRREKLLGKTGQARKGLDFSVPSRESAGGEGRGVQRRGDAGQAGGGAAASAKQMPRKAAAKSDAASKAKAKAPGGRLSKQEAAAVGLVEGAFPEPLRALLPKYRPQVLRDAILDALDSRTPDVIVDRVQRRWWKHGYEAAAAPGGKGIASPIGVAVALVRPSADCPEPLCEDGVILDQNVPCRTCEQRRGDRKTDRMNGVPAQRGEQDGAAPRPNQRWTCSNCRTPGRGEAPGDGLCRTCRAEVEEAAAAAARFKESLARAEAQRERVAAERWGAMLEEAYAENAERERAAAEDEARRQAERERKAKEDEETRLLREQITRDHPELVTYSQTG